MGIHGVFKEIGPGERIAFSKLALQKFEQTGRPLRIAVDISIWLFQVKSSKGGEQPALRTFYYRILRLTSLAIQPIFVFDGPNKPKFKRNKWSGPNVSSIPEFLAKQLLKEFGLPCHVAPGEAEAECALLQREGIVDAVLSEDVDTIMFGSQITLRSWSAEIKGKVPTHVNLYDSAKIKNGPSGLDRQGMILIAMMSGGDYITEGIPGCGPKIACEAARAGFGAELCNIKHNDIDGFCTWRQRLAHELRSNESKFFKRKHGALQIPDSFPNREILRFYTHPAISSPEALAELRSNLVWEKPMDLKALRNFTKEAFKWVHLIDAKKFIRTLAPALLVRELRLGAECRKPNIVKKIQRTRSHFSTDNLPELRISYIPIEVVDIDLSLETPDPVESMSDIDDGEEELAEQEQDDVPGSTQSQRPYLFEPDETVNLWVFEHFVKLGAKQPYQEWSRTLAQKAAQAAKAANKGTKTRRKKKVVDSSQIGAMHRYAQITKPGQGLFANGSNASKSSISQPLHQTISQSAQVRPFRVPPTTAATETIDFISLVSSSPPSSPKAAPVPKESHLSLQNNLPNITARRTPLGRTKALTEGATSTTGSTQVQTRSVDFGARPSISSSSHMQSSKRKSHVYSPITTPKANKKTSKSVLAPAIMAESPSGKGIITHYFSPSTGSRHIESLDLTLSPSVDSASSRFTRQQESLQFRSHNLGRSQSDVSGIYTHRPGNADASTGSIDLTMSSPTTSSIRRSQRARSKPADLPPVMQNASTRSTSPTPTSRERVMIIQSSSPPQQAISSRHLRTTDSNRQRVRVRESLKGSFAIENEVQASSAEANARTWMLSDISVFDLTGSQ